MPIAIALMQFEIAAQERQEQVDQLAVGEHLGGRASEASHRFDELLAWQAAQSGRRIGHVRRASAREEEMGGAGDATARRSARVSSNAIMAPMLCPKK